MSDQALDLLDDLLTRARRAGADAADALLVEGTSLSVQRRLGTIERVERAESRDLGLRFFVGRRVAILSTSELSPKGLERLVEQAAASARNLPEDPHAGLADADQIAREIPDLDLFDDSEPSAEHLIALAAAAEDSAIAVPGITNSEGAEAAFSKSTIALAASNGFRGAYRRARHSVSTVAIAGEGIGMERDYEYSQVVHPADHAAPSGAVVGDVAALEGEARGAGGEGALAIGVDAAGEHPHLLGAPRASTAAPQPALPETSAPMTRVSRLPGTAVPSLASMWMPDRGSVPCVLR